MTNNTPPKKAPWQDFNGNDIFDGSKITHPTGEQGVVEYEPLSKLWLVNYGTFSRSQLCLQIGDKGQAVVGQ